MSSEPISNDEIDRILNLERVPGSVTMLRPMEIDLSRELVEGFVRTSLHFLQRMPKPDKSILRAIQQRLDFLSWLSAQDETIRVAIYPTSEDGLSDDELQELIDDGILPFGDTPGDDDECDD